MSPTEPIPVWIEDDEVVFGHFGRRPMTAKPHLSTVWYGECHNVPPMMILPHQGADIEQISHLFGVSYVYEGDLLHILADNGTWVYRIHPAYWRDGTPEPWQGYHRFYDDIVIGRWPD